MSKSEVGKKELLFLDYANNSFREDPQNMPQYLSNAINILKVEACDTSEDDRIYLEMAQMVVATVEFFKKKMIIPSYAQYRRAIPSSFQNQTETWKRTVYATAYDFNRAVSPHHCGRDNCKSLFSEFKKGLLKKEMFLGHDRLRCYECDQLTFIDILQKITDGKDFTQLPSFYNLIQAQNALLNIVSQLDYDVDESCRPYKSTLKKSYSILLNLPLDLVFYRYKALRALLLALSTYSLTEYLLNDDRRKIKKCNMCGKFYIAKIIRADQKYCSTCSPKNKMTRAERTKYMRETYRPTIRRKKAVQIKKQRDKEVQKHIKAGIAKTEAEALEIIEFDSKV